MKLTCLQEHLRKGLTTVSRAVGTRSSLPILSNVLLETDGARLKLAANDLEIGITCWIDAHIDEAGAVALPARLFNDIVSNLPPDDVHLTLDARTQTVKLECARFTSHVKGREADEFPLIPTVTNRDAALRLPADLLRQSIEQVAFAASNDDTRMALKGVLIRVIKNNQSGGCTIKLSATDSYRLAVRTITVPEATLPEEAPSAQEFLVSARALSELARITGDSDEHVFIAVTPGEGHALFCTETTELASRLIGEKFPDFERIIPTEHTTRTLVDTQALLKAVKLASFFATADQNFVKLTIEPGDEVGPGRMVISANAAEVGDNTGELDGTVQGEGGQIAMNVKFMAEALAAMGTSQVALEIQTPDKPGVFKPVGHDDYIHLIMPIRMR
ncbi:MAG: DNA polymerase III subunit beta [Chloroflexaceae bacterium]|nr:DNA polymerase III subunit beta [Chloroflexaceae bacterium]